MPHLVVGGHIYPIQLINKLWFTMSVFNRDQNTIFKAIGFSLREFSTRLSTILYNIVSAVQIPSVFLNLTLRSQFCGQPLVSCEIPAEVMDFK